MKRMRWMLACLMICEAAWASDGARGTVPREAATKYGAHAEQNSVAIGATLLTAKDVRKVFKTDVGHCCVVVEVALYPQNGGQTAVSLNDFALRVVGQDVGAKPSSAKVVAWQSSKDSDRLRPRLIEDMETELTEKSLPQGVTTAPVSGYLYFPLAKTKNAAYQLEYTVQGNKVALALH
jgi:hypothetical protein